MFESVSVEDLQGWNKEGDKDRCLRYARLLGMNSIPTYACVFLCVLLLASLHRVVPLPSQA